MKLKHCLLQSHKRRFAACISMHLMLSDAGGERAHLTPQQDRKSTSLCFSVSVQSEVLAVRRQDPLLTPPSFTMTHPDCWGAHVPCGDALMQTSLETRDIPCRLTKSLSYKLKHMNLEVKVWVAQSHPTLCDPLDCSPPGFSVHGIFSRPGYWSGLPFRSPGDLPDPGIEPTSPSLLRCRRVLCLLRHRKRPLCWERMRAGGEGDGRERHGRMASPTRWTWVWANSGR